MGGSLIVAIGAQNAFVLSQGVKKEHHILIPTICIICDMVLIMIGVAGVGTLIASNPDVKFYASWGGAIFLTWYGINSLKSAIKGSNEGLDTGNGGVGGNVILITLGLTLLNPHVYLDTIVLMGSISGQHEGTGRYVFGLGACLASIVWFFALSFCGTMLAPIFKKKKSWQILDFLIALTMFSIALMLVL